MRVLTFLATNIILLGILFIPSVFAGESNQAHSDCRQESSDTNTILVYQLLRIYISSPMGNWFNNKSTLGEWKDWESKSRQFIQRTVEQKSTKADIWSCDLADDCRVEVLLEKNMRATSIKVLQSSLNPHFDAIISDTVKAWTQSAEFQFPKHIYKTPAKVMIEVGIHEKDTCTGESLQDFVDGKCKRYNGCAGMGWEARELMMFSKRLKKQYLYSHESQELFKDGETEKDRPVELMKSKPDEAKDNSAPMKESN